MSESAVVQDSNPEKLRMLVGGAWVHAENGATLLSVNPATEEPLAHIPHSSRRDVATAVEAAIQGFDEWRRFNWAKRSSVMRELAARMSEQAEAFAQIDVKDAGLPINAMRADAAQAPANILHFAGIASELNGTTFEAPGDTVALSLREPYGVVGRIIPFNHPFRFCAKIAPAIAAGNSVILKPSEATSLSALAFGELTIGLFPDGVVNVLTGLGSTTGAAIVAHPKVPRIAFTGGLQAGKAIMRDAAENLKHCTFELGGKNPMIVFPDVDIVRAARACVESMNLSRSMGQSCQSTSRVYVHASIHDRFVDAIVEQLARLVVGDPRREDTDMGPLAYEAHYRRVIAYVESGIAEGATVAFGGTRPAELTRGYYLQPTLFIHASDDMRIAREEIFGPVITVMRWSDWDDVIERANALDVGLTANIWTNDLSVALKTARAVQSGSVRINGPGARMRGMPFGGYKLSGLGREGNLADLLSYTQEKTIQATLLD